MRKQDTTGFRNEKEEEKEGAKVGEKAGKTSPLTLKPYAYYGTLLLCRIQ